jgi:ribonuclease HII
MIRADRADLQSRMGVLIAGVDEAGYGPMLGPLCVGLTVFEAPGAPGQVPCLWQALAAGVCKAPGRGGRADASGRVAIADSKQLKLASSVKTTHPLVHLERGVLACVGCLQPDEHEDGLGLLPSTDAGLLAMLEARPPGEAWYERPVELPVAHGAGQIAIASNLLRRAMGGSGVRLHEMRCRVVGEGEFNALAREGGKAATTGAALREHLGLLWREYASRDQRDGAGLSICCDRQGGRTCYAEFLESALPGAKITTLEETDTRSTYVAEGTGADGLARRAGLAFLVGAEQKHLPVALASMVAKYVRELMMTRFNAWWGERARAVAGLDLTPTAGYTTDARRWLHDARDAIDEAQRERLVRIA